MLVACGGQETGNGGPTTEASPTQIFNDTDVAFAQQRIVHHQQAITMAQIAQSHGPDPKVRQLAGQIEAEQAPEIQTMAGWLQAWGMPTMTSGTMPSPGMMPSMPTMMPQPDMSPMMGMQGAAFDRMLLQMMIIHHQDAVEMAKAEEASGANPEAMQLAKTIETSQTAQITQLQQMLSTPAPTKANQHSTIPVRRGRRPMRRMRCCRCTSHARQRKRPPRSIEVGTSGVSPHRARWPAPRRARTATMPARCHLLVDPPETPRPAPGHVGCWR